MRPNIVGIAGYINVTGGYYVNNNTFTGTLTARDNNTAGIAITGTKATEATGNLNNGTPAVDGSLTTGEGYIR